MTGPNLWGIFGRKAGTADGFSYSDIMKAQTFTWDAARIDKWITDPRNALPGTKMTFCRPRPMRRIASMSSPI